MRHAKLAPSASHRWMNCGGSIEATKDLTEDPANLEAACYGTGAHSFSEKLLAKEIFEADDRYLGKTFRYRFNDTPAQLTIDADFIEHVNVYLGRVGELSRQGGKLTIEQLVQLDFIRPGMFGHMDTLVDSGRRIVVADLKFGFVPVFLVENPDALLFDNWREADINTQLLCYAAGALEMCHWLPEEVQLEIIQPRSFEVESIQSIVIPTSFIEEWVDNVAKPAAERAEDPQAPLAAGEWCRFCPAKVRPDGSTCPEFMRHTSQLITTEFSEFVTKEAKLPDVTQLSIEQLLNVLKWTPILDAFLREANAHAFQLMMSGSDALKGHYKLVRGRGSRYFPFPDYLTGVTELSVAIASTMLGRPATAEDEALLKEIAVNITVPIVLRSPKQIEDLGGAYKANVKLFAEKRAGNLTMAVDSDRRAGVEPFTSFEDLGLTTHEQEGSEEE